MLVCASCEAAFPVDRPRWRCECGSYLMLSDTGMFAPGTLASRPASLWRYREALGIDDSSPAVTLGEGFTPLADATLDGFELKLKLDFLCPTGSYKDRGSAVMITKLKSWGVTEIIEDSSGNAGASIAAYSALAGVRANIYIPESASAGKAAQIAMYGARLIKVAGTRADTARVAWDAASEMFYASHNWSPYFLAGMKTAAYEIAEQMSWNSPDWVVLPVGGGGLLSGLYLGFADLLRAGIIRSMPRLAAVQSANCDPIYRAWSTGLPDVPGAEPKPTAAEGIAVAKPVRGRAILEAIRGSNGVVRTIADDLLWDSVEALGRLGVYVEPTAAAAPAAIAAMRHENLIAGSDRVVVILTGSGLKATDKVVEHYAAREPAMAGSAGPKHRVY
jgi:threonine synthase